MCIYILKCRLYSLTKVNGSVYSEQCTPTVYSLEKPREKKTQTNFTHKLQKKRINDICYQNSQYLNWIHSINRIQENLFFKKKKHLNENICLHFVIFGVSRVCCYKQTLNTLLNLFLFSFCFLLSCVLCTPDEMLNMLTRWLYTYNSIADIDATCWMFAASERLVCIHADASVEHVPYSGLCLDYAIYALSIYRCIAGCWPHERNVMRTSWIVNALFQHKNVGISFVRLTFLFKRLLSNEIFSFKTKYLYLLFLLSGITLTSSIWDIFKVNF